MAKHSLTPKLEKFVLKWGERATHWGLNRTEAQIHALLFISEKPLNAQQISEALSVARSNVSNSLKELQRWGLIRVVHALGDRRDHFESLKDVWEIFRRAVSEQKRREIDPVVSLLQETVSDLKDSGEDAAYARENLARMQVFFEIMGSWYDDMRPVPTPVIKNFLKLGAKAVHLLGKK